MGRQYFADPFFWSTADGTAVTANGTETIIFPDVTIPGNFMQDGRVLAGDLWGKFSTTTGPPTARFRTRWGGVGGTLLMDSGTITTIASVTNAIWRMTYMVTTRTNGTAGSLFGIGEVKLFGAVAATVGSATGAPAIAPMSAGGITAPAAVGSLDLTANASWSDTLTWSSASNSLTGHNRYLQAWN